MGRLAWNRPPGGVAGVRPRGPRATRAEILRPLTGSVPMCSPSTRVLPTFAASVLLLISVGLPSTASGGDFKAAMDQFAGRIKQLLDGEREGEIALNQFIAPAKLSANASSGIRKALEDGLTKRGVRIRKTAHLEIIGEYREIDDKLQRKSVVRIFGRIVNQDTGRPLGECEVKVDNLISMA